ncbi:concanavalin A-like lectin/glucanase domain-containing protein [Aspergillus pseudodeflectus]|uniref:Glucanase n=1 Tax=Aspergillus pseudodeflectus TaxID=176178 RepID=A0ABR4JUR4_9EURO
MARTLATAVIALAALPLITAQQIGTPERRPHLDTWKCTTAHGCTKQKTSVVLDAATHQIHQIGTDTPCAVGETLDPDLCPDKETCASNCVIDGITDYAAFGVTTQGSRLTLRQYLRDAKTGDLTSVSPRVYLVDEEGSNPKKRKEKNYEFLHLLNQEFTFDVDVSLLPCGMNGALYLSEMEPSGGRSRKLNPAGAAYGTGYCDAQCYVHPWINGEANIDSNGACCNEMDIWEGNSRATGFTPHACHYPGGGLYECTSDEECNGPTGENDSICDKWGCGFNPYALGDQEYYGRGRGFDVDSKRPFTVVTQFVTSDNTTEGTLVEIRRLYIQDGKVIGNAVVQGGRDSMTDALCENTASWFEGFDGLDGMGRALGRGMVLAMSIWNDAGGYMQWLDGGNSGPCNATEGAPSFIEANTPDTRITFANIRWGEIGSTYKRWRH